MSLTKLGKLVFFLLSYYLLFLFLISDDLELQKISISLPFDLSIGLNWFICILLTLFVFSMTFYIFYVKKLPSKVFEITSIENLSAETLNYLVSIVLGVISYSIPFLSFKMLILLVLFYLTYLAGDIYYLQPILVVFGYKVYKCKIDGGNSVMLITKDDYVGKGKVETYEITKGIYLMRG